MKKSTILRKISRLLKTNPSASEILDLVQKEGMLPPYSHQCDLGCECGCHGRCPRSKHACF